MALLPATLEVSFDEPAFNLSELVQPTPSSGPHRFQIILVVRGDSLAEYRLDLGPANDFSTPEFRIPGGVVDEVTGRGEILHTVGELKDIADMLRQRAAPQVQARDIWGEYHNFLEEREKYDTAHSTFGYNGNTVRG
jgi:hypothetical protein